MELKNFLSNPYQTAICLLLIIEQLEAFDEFALINRYEKFSEKDALFLRKEGRYPLLLPVLFLISEDIEQNKGNPLMNEKYREFYEDISEVVGNLSQITDGICISQKNNLTDSRELENEYLKKSRLMLEDILRDIN